MFCSNCGKQLIDGAYSCPYCGEVVPTREKKSEESAPMVEKEVKAEESVAAAADEAKKEWTPDAQPAYIPTEEPVAQPEKAKKMPTITLVGFIASLASILWSIFAIPGLIISLIALKGYKKDPTLPGKNLHWQV